MENNQKIGIESPNNKFKIKVTENGPYIISGGVPLTTQIIVLDSRGYSLAWLETKQYPVQQKYSLCRCGKSKNKPFCDNTHKVIPFNGTETASYRSYAERCEKFTGPELLLMDVRDLCAHTGFCDRAGGTRYLVSSSNDQKSRTIAIEEVYNCPSGRLVLRDKEGDLIEPALQPSIGLMQFPDGSLCGLIWVKGGIPIESAKGGIYEIRNRVTLCGCGESSNKPFCDGTHRKKHPHNLNRI